MEPIALNNLIRSRAHRILKSFERYQNLEDQDIAVLIENGLQLQTGEELIGMYKNHDDNFSETIVITTLGLHVFFDEWDLVEYSQINKVSIPLNYSKDKFLADRILVQLKHGSEIEIPVTGEHGKLRDAWEFLRFLQRVQKDFQHNKLKP